MSLQLKSGETFTDKSNVVHEEAFISNYAAEFTLGRIIYHSAIWKDSVSFLDSVQGGPSKPFQYLPDIVIGGADFVTYFLTPNVTVTNRSRMSINSDGFYAYLSAHPEAMPDVDLDDFDEVGIPGVPGFSEIPPKK